VFDVGSGPEADRKGAKRTVGKDTGGSEKVKLFWK
jgi:hypothetical protein